MPFAIPTRPLRPNLSLLCNSSPNTIFSPFSRQQPRPLGIIGLELRLLLVDALAALAGARGVASLDHEAGDDAVEERVVVVAVEEVLEEIAARQGCLVGKEGEG